MSAQEVEQVNLECDLISLINQQAWPHGDKIVKELLSLYNVERKSPRPVALSIAAKND